MKLTDLRDNPGATKDYDLYIYNSVGTLLTSAEGGTGVVDTASTTNTGTTAIARYVRVTYYSGGSGTYSLKVTW